MALDVNRESVRHKLYEDAIAMLLGSGLVALGVVFYAKASLSTGSTAGMAFIVHYLTGWAFGPLFFAINIPFYVFALMRMGLKFTIRSFIGVSLVALFSSLFPQWIIIDGINPVFAALTGGTMMGLGVLSLFRHRASLGGINVVALYLQENWGWRAGYVQLAVDVVILGSALLVLSPREVGLSMLGAAALNMVVALNHRAGRYMGVS